MPSFKIKLILSPTFEALSAEVYIQNEKADVFVVAPAETVLP